MFCSQGSQIECIRASTNTLLVHVVRGGSDAERCEGCDIVQSDHAPQAGVAQGIFDGELVRRRVGHQVELEEEQDKEVERRVRRDAQRTTHKCACMDDME